jgi:hypothetical protein
MSVTYYVALPFERTEDGDLVPVEAMEAPSAGAAQRLAMRFSLVKAGAVAFSRTGDPDSGEFEDAVVIAKYGELPAELPM